MNPEQDYLSDLQPAENFGYELASPGIRFAAVILEGIIIHLPLYFIFGDDSPLHKTDIWDVPSILIQAGFNALLGAVFYSLWSGNLGHKLLGLKVISAVDGSDQKKALTGAMREALKNLLGMFIIPSIWLLWDAKKQNLYDKITQTLVVRNQ